MELRVLPDADAVAAEARGRFIAAAGEAIARQGRFRVALAGGLASSDAGTCANATAESAMSIAPSGIFRSTRLSQEGICNGE